MGQSFWSLTHNAQRGAVESSDVTGPDGEGVNGLDAKIIGQRVDQRELQGGALEAG